MADHDAFAEQYHRFKESPFCRFAEEPTYFTIIGDLEGKSVLDLACGEGHYTRLIAARVRGGEEVTAPGRRLAESSLL